MLERKARRFKKAPFAGPHSGLRLEWGMRSQLFNKYIVIKIKINLARKALAMAVKVKTIVWLDDAQEHNYPAAESYLSLIYEAKRVRQLVKKLREAAIVEFKAKDVFRASGLSLLGVSNSHVEKDSKKIAKKTALSPLLLVRDPSLGKVVIADGYHRMCAIYLVDEDALIRCKIV